MKYFNFIGIIILVFTSCSNPTNVEDEESLNLITEKDKSTTVVENDSDTEMAGKSAFKSSCTFGEIEIQVEEKDNEVFVRSNGEAIEDFSFKMEGDLISMIETDVDGDGYNEFYCLSNKGDIKAFASYRNKSFGEIYVKQKPNAFYENCENVKFWDVKNKRLFIAYSSQKNEEINTVRYHLEKGETSYKLLAE